MNDYRLPDLPSDEELGITDKDRERLKREYPKERPELSKEEMVALLGQTFSRGEKQEGNDVGGSTQEKAVPRPPMPEGPRSRWRGPLTLSMLVAVSVFASSRTGLPRPVPANASDTVFSSSRAMSMLIEIARRPHPTGSPEHARVRAYLLDRLRSLGLEPEVQTATSMIQRENSARAATVRNVLARLPGTASTGAVLLTAHYDSRERAPGAGDDGSGVVTILEAIRALRTGEPMRNDVIVLLTDAEELGMLGARAFVDGHPWMEDVSVVLSFEMRGGGGPSIMFETNDDNGWIVRALDEFDPHPFANSMAYEVYERMPNDTDFTPFKEAGKQGLNFAAIDNAHVYHQASDTPENVSEKTLQHHGLQALAALEYFGGADLGTVTAPDVVYFSVPVLGLVVYPGFWVLPIAGGLLLLMALVAWSARRAGGRVAGMLVGLGLAILGGALSFVAALGLLRWIPRFHPEADSLVGSYHSEGWYVLALAAVVVTLVTAIQGVARRWLSSAELALGAAVVPLGLALWLSISFPLAAMNLQWPVAAALLSALVVVMLGARASGVVGWIAALLLVVPVLVLLVPVVELLWLVLSVEFGGVLAVLMALTVHLSLPAIDALRHPNSWWAPLVGLGVAGAAVGMGILAASTSADRPAPSTLAYAYEHGTGSAVWLTDPAADPVLDAEAMAWAAARAGSSFSRTADLSRFAYPPGEIPVTDAPIVDAALPQVIVLMDTIAGGTRRVTLGVRSRVGAEMLRFQRDTVGGTRLLSVDGAPVERPDSLAWAEHWGEPDSLVVLELDMPAEEPIGLYIVEHLLRPEELLGSDAFARPPHLAPDVRSMSDRVALRFSVAAFADPRHAFMPRPSAEPDADIAAPDAEALGRAAAGAPADTLGGPPVAAGLPADTSDLLRDTLR